MFIPSLPLLLLLLVQSASSTHSACEKLDGDCPKCNHPWRSGQSPVATVHLSIEKQLVQSTIAADKFLKQLAPTEIQRFDNPLIGLHTSLFYFCCHSSDQIKTIKEAFQHMIWDSFLITYDSFSCNLDHNNKTVYLHALPSNQTDLFAWANIVEKTLESYNVTINHPRKSLFHMTLARVNPSYPIDTAVRTLNKTNFGNHRLCNFTFMGDMYHANDCK